MTSEQFHDALTLLPEDLVAHAEQYRCRKQRNRKTQAQYRCRKHRNPFFH